MQQKLRDLFKQPWDTLTGDEQTRVVAELLRQQSRMEALQALGIPGAMFRLGYFCKRCNVSWEDEWSCACNSRCPSCDVEHEPREVEELGDTGEDDE